jgi:hypothetical protein
MKHFTSADVFGCVLKDTGNQISTITPNVARCGVQLT